MQLPAAREKPPIGLEQGSKMAHEVGSVSRRVQSDPFGDGFVASVIRGMALPNERKAITSVPRLDFEWGRRQDDQSHRRNLLEFAPTMPSGSRIAIFSQFASPSQHSQSKGLLFLLSPRSESGLHALIRRSNRCFRSFCGLYLMASLSPFSWLPKMRSPRRPIRFLRRAESDLWQRG